MTLTKIKDMDKTYSFKKYQPKIVGEDCLCGITFQHIHKDGEGYKNPIGVVDAVEMGLLDKSDNPKEQEWENYNWEIKLTILYIKNKGIMDLTELKPFIRQLIKEAKDDGITEGLNLTRMTFEANREAWEKEAREEAKRELIKEIEEWIDKVHKQLQNGESTMPDDWNCGYVSMIETLKSKLQQQRCRKAVIINLEI